MDDSSYNSWSFTDTTRAGKSCRVYTEHNGQFETEDMEAFGHGTFQFYKKKVQTNAIQVGCSNERKGCKVRALISLSGEFLKYLGETNGPPIHNHFPFYGSHRQSGPKSALDRSHLLPRIMSCIGENRHGFQFYQCPNGFVFFVNGMTKLKDDRVEFELSCAERRDGCKARITCNSEDLAVTRERGEHHHLPVSVETLRTRNFEIHCRDRFHQSMGTHNQNQNIEDGSIDETDTDSSDMGYAVGERTPYSSQIISPEDGPHDFWADPIAVCTDHNYTIDSRNRNEEQSIIYEVDPKSQEIVVVSADSFNEYFDHTYVPDAEIVVEIPFNADEGQVSSVVSETESLCPMICKTPNKLYVSRVER